jgi:peptide/nickel transport system permease protein
LVTIFGLDFGLLIGTAVLTETVFSLQGLGKYSLDGIFSNDLPKVLGVTLMAAFFVAIANFAVDLLYAVVDPRVRTS